MVSADMCEHGWPGSSCPECRAERRAYEVSRMPESSTNPFSLMTQEEINRHAARLVEASQQTLPISKDKLCSKCRSGYLDDLGRAHCGASPDDRPQPYWAARKYSIIGMGMILNGDPYPNADCEDLDNSVGEVCRAYVEES